MTGLRHRLSARLALFGLLAVALGLAACGRKSGLDAPPDASLAQSPAPAPAPQPSTPGMVPIGSAPPPGEPGIGIDGKPVAPRGPNRRIFLDNILN